MFIIIMNVFFAEDDISAILTSSLNTRVNNFEKLFGDLIKNPEMLLLNISGIPKLLVANTTKPFAIASNIALGVASKPEK